MNHKAKRPRSQRAGCGMCKPHKKTPKAQVKYRDKRQDAHEDVFDTTDLRGNNA